MENKKGKLEKAQAPYNFVSFPEKVIKRYDTISDLPKHDTFQEGRLEGFVDYTMLCKTPTMIGSNKTGQFFKNSKDQFVIPGSTIKGMLRNNMVFLGLGIAGDFIEDRRFLYRDVAGNSGKMRKDYKDRLGIVEKKNYRGKTSNEAKEVKAGYIYKTGDEAYSILPAQTIKGKTYFKVNEKTMERKEIFIEGMKKLSQKNTYQPYSVEVSYSINEENMGVKSIKNSDKKPQEKYTGYLCGSGPMYNKNEKETKKAHYIINEVEKIDKEIKLDVRDIRTYQEEFRKNHKISKIEYYKLPKEKGLQHKKPIFYVSYNGKTYFGFTPYLRLFYDHSIKEGMSEKQKSMEILDYTRSLFGFTKIRQSSYKSRISTEDAQGIQVNEGRAYTIILAEPKASYYPSYVKQKSKDKNQLITYNDDFEIRGGKFYWLKDGINQSKVANNQSQNKTIYPVDVGSVFKGRIYFNNLSQDELGLLLWSLSLRFEQPAYQSIGLGKPYGFGRVQVQDIEVNIIDPKRKYAGFNTNYVSTTKEYECYIDTYKKYVKEYYQINLDETEQVKEFKTIKTTIVNSKLQEFSYMDLKSYNDKLVLPTITEVQKSLSKK